MRSSSLGEVYVERLARDSESRDLELTSCSPSCSALEALPDALLLRVVLLAAAPEGRPSPAVSRRLRRVASDPSLLERLALRCRLPAAGGPSPAVAWLCGLPEAELAGVRALRLVLEGRGPPFDEAEYLALDEAERDAYGWEAPRVDPDLPLLAACRPLRAGLEELDVDARACSFASASLAALAPLAALRALRFARPATSSTPAPTGRPCGRPSPPSPPCPASPPWSCGPCPPSRRPRPLAALPLVTLGARIEPSEETAPLARFTRLRRLALACSPPSGPHAPLRRPAPAPLRLTALTALHLGPPVASLAFLGPLARLEHASLRLAAGADPAPLAERAPRLRTLLLATAVGDAAMPARLPLLLPHFSALEGLHLSAPVEVLAAVAEAAGCLAGLARLRCLFLHHPQQRLHDSVPAAFVHGLALEVPSLRELTFLSDAPTYYPPPVLAALRGRLARVRVPLWGSKCFPECARGPFEAALGVASEETFRIRGFLALEREIQARAPRPPAPAAEFP
eukprot:tig00021318_g20141.t1